MSMISSPTAVTSSLPKSNNEENVSPQIGTKGGGFDKVERMLLPFTPATSKSPLRKSQDFLNPSTALAQAKTNFKLDRLNTDEFLHLEAAAIASTPTQSRSHSPAPRTPSPYNHLQPMASDLSNYLTATGEKNFDSPSSLASLSTSPHTATTSQGAGGKLPLTPLTPKIQPSSSLSTGSSGRSGKSGESGVDNYWRLDGSEVVKKLADRVATPGHQRRVSWEDGINNGDNNNAEERESQRGEESPFKGYDTPRVRKRLENITQNAEVGGRGSKLTKSMNGKASGEMEGKELGHKKVTGGSSPVEPPALGGRVKTQQCKTSVRRKEKTFGPMIGGGAPELGFGGGNFVEYKSNVGVGTSTSTNVVKNDNMTETCTPKTPSHHLPPPLPPSSSPPLELVDGIERRLSNMFPGVDVEEIKGAARDTARALGRRGFKGVQDNEEEGKRGREGEEVKGEMNQHKDPGDAAGGGRYGNNAMMGEDGDDVNQDEVVIGEVEEQPSHVEQEEAHSTLSSPPSRRPVETPVKTAHSSPPSRRPVTTPNNNTEGVGRMRSEEVYSNDERPRSEEVYTREESEFPSDVDSIPSRMPVSTPTGTPSARSRSGDDEHEHENAPTPCELKYVNNTWTLTPMKFNETAKNESYLDTHGSEGTRGDGNIQMTWKCYTLDHPMSATLPLANDSSEEVTITITSSSAAFEVPISSVTLPPSSSSDVSVIFNPPPLETVVRGELAIVSTKAEKRQAVALKGIVVEEPMLQVDRGIMAWTRGGGGSKVLKIRNSGRSKVRVKAEVEEGDEFEVVGERSRNLKPGREAEVRVRCRDVVGERDSNLVLSVIPTAPPSNDNDDENVVEDTVHFLEPRIFDVTLSVCGGSLLPTVTEPPKPPPELEERVQDVGDIWDDHVGQRLMKPFEDDVFEGVVVEHFDMGDRGGLWRVRYTDGDEEDLEIAELTAAIKFYERGGIVPYRGVEEGLKKLIEEDEEEDEEEGGVEAQDEFANAPQGFVNDTPQRFNIDRNNDTEITFEPSTSILTASETPRKVQTKSNNNDTTIGTEKTDKSKERGEGRVYFRRSVVEFGEKTVGTCGSMRLQLCNSTEKEVVVRVSEPSCPFVVLHKKIRLKPKAFVRLPVRFVPVSKGLWESMLHCDVGEGRSEIVVLLRGRGK